jgi:hypothetical protein
MQGSCLLLLVYLHVWTTYTRVLSSSIHYTGSVNCHFLLEQVPSSSPRQPYPPLTFTLRTKPENALSSEENTIFCVTTQRVVIISYGRFRKTYRSHPQGSRIQKDKSLAALNSTLPSIPATCNNPIGWHHTAETFHLPHSFLCKLRIGVKGFTLDS